MTISSFGRYARVGKSMLYLSLAIATYAQPKVLASPLVRVESGTLRGQTLAKGGAFFLGIPYAAAPTGELRWRDPRPAPHWSGARDATHYGSACMQPAAGWNDSLIPTASEDCLFLNIWTPKLDSSARLPVMVWIHGGGFTGGGANDSLFAGEHFAAKNVVLVTLNYRLGLFGFLALPDLSKSSDHKVSGNYGLLDQHAALRWVHENIANFGGDPGAITVFGQSAGGGSVLALLASPLTHDFLRSAIVESGSLITTSGMMRLQDAEAQGLRFAGTLSLIELRSQPATELMHRWQDLASTTRGMKLGPIVDGYVLTDDPVTVFAQHKEHPVALIVGNNAREGFGMVRDADLPQVIRDFYGEAAPAALDLYSTGPGKSLPVDPVLGSPAAQWLTDSSLRCSAVIMAARHQAAKAPVYSYQFEQPLPGRENQGAAHSYELPYVFGNLLDKGPLGAPFSSTDRALSDLMMTYWTNFARHGDPNGPGIPHWPRFTNETRAYMRLSTALQGNAAAGQGLRQAACQLFENRVTHASLGESEK
jgi:para-nitrobenzyl esterase